MGDLSEQLSSVGTLADTSRRALYEYVLGQAEPVSREQAADAMGLPAHSVKFHLDKLVAGGLLDVEYRRLTGRTGPGAGRTAKLYRRSAHEVSLSVPRRRYDLAGEVLAEAVDRSVHDGVPVADTVEAVAGDVGRELGAGATPSSDGDGDGADDLRRASAVLEAHGYEPRILDEELCLANCPFDRLAAEHTDLVCGMNLSLVRGVLDGLRVGSLAARLTPTPGWCCVRVCERA